MAAPTDEKLLLRKLKTFALISRILIIFLQIIFNICIPDHNAVAFNPPYHDDSSIITLLIGGFRRWDAVYFMHIAEFGYTYESALAFFPSFPLVIRLVSNTFLYPLTFICSYNSVLLISSCLTNMFLFVKNAENLYKLGKHVTKNDYLAYTGALLYCINPASVFMSAPYSETMFTYFTLTGLIYLEENKKLSAAVYIGLSCITRSNGLLNLGYLLYVLGKKILFTIKNLWRSSMKDVTIIAAVLWVIFVTTILPYILLIAICLFPFIMYQYYCYHLFCSNDYMMDDIPDYIVQYGRENDLKVVGDTPSSWCNDTFPLAYSYVQKHYWHQGLLNYWEFKQIPNFILAIPVSFLVFMMSIHYYKNNKYICWTLGIDEVGAIKKKSETNNKYYTLEGVKLLPYVIHPLILTLFGWFFIHVQVLTRLLFSSTPVLYWYTAQLVFRDIPKQENKYNKYDVTKSDCVQVETNENQTGSTNNLLADKIRNTLSEPFSTRIILIYFMGYYVIGVALFSNFLPWT
ncbi:hypothetical protein ACF0H5_016076 [Mactra antiquata]